MIIDKSLDKIQWDNFVVNNPNNLFSHLYGWAEAFSIAYDVPIIRLAARDTSTGRIVGVLPLALFAFPGDESRLISLPYTDGAGLLADSPEAALSLLKEAITTAEQHRVQHLELRQQGGVLDRYIKEKYSNSPANYRYRQHTFKIGMVRPLAKSADHLWKNMSAKVRNQVRKARRVECRAVVGAEEMLDDFYMVFSENMRDLGSPVHSRTLLSQMADELREHLLVFVVYHGTVPAAGAVVFGCSTTLFNPWASSLRGFRPLCPNMLLYWTMLSYGCDNGYTLFDFGRSSPDASSCRFKMQWGACRTPLVWHVLSMTEHVWNPKCESLEYDWWRNLTVEEAVHRGQEARKRISL